MTDPPVPEQDAERNEFPHAPLEHLERCLATQADEGHGEVPPCSDRRTVVLEPTPDGKAIRYKRPRDLQAPGFGIKMLEVMDGEALRKQIRAVWGESGDDEYTELVAFALEDMLAELEPRDTLERLLVQQMFVLHRQVMTMIHRANDNLSPRDIRGHNDVVTRLATTFRRHYEEFQKHRAPAAFVAIHGDGNTVNLAAAQQVISEGDPARMQALVFALDGLTEALRIKLEADRAPD